MNETILDQAYKADADCWSLGANHLGYYRAFAAIRKMPPFSDSALGPTAQNRKTP